MGHKSPSLFMWGWWLPPAGGLLWADKVPLLGACGTFFLQALAAANTKQVKIFVLGTDFNHVSSAKTQMGLDLSRHLFYSTDFWKWFLVWCLMFFKLYFIMPWKVIYGCDFERDHNLTFCPFFFTRNFRTISMYLWWAINALEKKCPFMNEISSLENC